MADPIKFMNGRISDKELEQKILEAGKCLFPIPSSVDELLLVLDRVENFLTKVQQSPSISMQISLSPSVKALISSELMRHSDVDVKVAVASCISEITRITAPIAPYDDDRMKEVFQLIVSSFEKLSEKSSRSYNKRTSILETVAKVRSCLLMLDLECDTLIIEMFQHFLKSVRDYHPRTVFTYMETIMIVVLEESEDISVNLLVPILASLKKDNKEFLPVAQKLGKKVFEKCSSKVKPYLLEAVKSLGIDLKDYSQVVSAICLDNSCSVDQDNDNVFSGKRANEESLPKTSLKNAPKTDAEIASGTSDADVDISSKEIMSSGIIQAVDCSFMLDSVSLNNLTNKSTMINELKNIKPDDDHDTGKIVDVGIKTDQTSNSKGNSYDSIASLDLEKHVNSSPIDNDKEAEKLPEVAKSHMRSVHNSHHLFGAAVSLSKNPKGTAVEIFSPKDLQTETLSLSMSCQETRLPARVLKREAKLPSDSDPVKDYTDVDFTSPIFLANETMGSCESFQGAKLPNDVSKRVSEVTSDSTHEKETDVELSSPNLLDNETSVRTENIQGFKPVAVPKMVSDVISDFETGTINTDVEISSPNSLDDGTLAPSVKVQEPKPTFHVSDRVCVVRNDPELKKHNTGIEFSSPNFLHGEAFSPSRSVQETKQPSDVSKKMSDVASGYEHEATGLEFSLPNSLDNETLWPRVKGLFKQPADVLQMVSVLTSDSKPEKYNTDVEISSTNSLDAEALSQRENLKTAKSYVPEKISDLTSDSEHEKETGIDSSSPISLDRETLASSESLQEDKPSDDVPQRVSVLTSDFESENDNIGVEISSPNSLDGETLPSKKNPQEDKPSDDVPQRVSVLTSDFEPEKDNMGVEISSPNSFDGETVSSRKSLQGDKPSDDVPQRVSVLTSEFETEKDNIDTEISSSNTLDGETLSSRKNLQEAKLPSDIPKKLSNSENKKVTGVDISSLNYLHGETLAPCESLQEDKLPQRASVLTSDFQPEKDNIGVDISSLKFLDGGTLSPSESLQEGKPPSDVPKKRCDVTSESEHEKETEADILSPNFLEGEALSPSESLQETKPPTIHKMASEVTNYFDLKKEIGTNLSLPKAVNNEILASGEDLQESKPLANVPKTVSEDTSNSELKKETDVVTLPSKGLDNESLDLCLYLQGAKPAVDVPKRVSEVICDYELEKGTGNKLSSSKALGNETLVPIGSVADDTESLARQSSIQELPSDGTIRTFEHEKKNVVEFPSPNGLDSETSSPIGSFFVDTQLKNQQPKKNGLSIQETIVLSGAPKRTSTVGDSEVKYQRRTKKNKTSHGIADESNIPNSSDVRQEIMFENSDTKQLKLSDKKMDSSNQNGVGPSIRQKQDKENRGREKASLHKNGANSLAENNYKEMMTSPKSAILFTEDESVIEQAPVKNPKRKRPSVKEKVCQLENLVGCKIKVYWPEDNMFYTGIVDSFDSVEKKHKVLYTDGDEEILNLNDEEWSIDNIADKAADLPSPIVLSQMPKKKRKMDSDDLPENKIYASLKSGRASSKKSKNTSTKTSSKSNSKKSKPYGKIVGVNKLEDVDVDVKLGTLKSGKKLKQETKTFEKSKCIPGESKGNSSGKSEVEKKNLNVKTPVSRKRKKPNKAQG